ncbi:hypothetical protein VI817_005262 [Penicillium citrinum]|uniref:Mtf2-like C-terminal domain-containing protein n=1 Tax=Penicillium hetheringtonii TaxID=911720 RepID=A0AAD6DES4_9EURO|nr:hypothetical protein N7450_008575 [Penicillium hetheringtonii]KAK5795977.1 hypothetical protein VI817_005262 [Penicillium citrinum]
MATNISRALLLSATANTATPFLYQTRTLSPVLRSFQRPCTPRLQRTLSTRTSDLEVTDDADTDGSVAESTTKSAGSHQSRRNHLRRRGTSASRHSKSPEKFKSVTSKERAAFNKLLSQLNDDVSGNDPVTQSTTEQSAKQNDIAELMKLFGGIIHGNAQQKSSRQTPQKSPEAAPDNAIQQSDDIKFENLQDMAVSGSEEIEGMPMDEATFSREELGLPPTSIEAERPLSMREAVKLISEREACVIERALFEAIEANKGDMAVWEVCKTHIFSMLHCMEGSEFAKSSIPEKFEANLLAPASHNAVTIPPMIPAGVVITKLYPRALLMAFRLLNTHFPDSQLISQFRASIKAQGRSSAILGASPELFHEMVQFYWHGCRDLSGVVSFLHDMDLHGVHPLRETITLLRDIERQGRAHLRARSRSPEDSQEKNHFWDFPPNQKALVELSVDGGWLERFKKIKQSNNRSRSRRRAA